MTSERVQRQVDRLLDEAEEAIALRQWEDLRATCEVVLNLDPENSDATQYLALADKSLATDVASDSSDIVEPSEDPTPESVVDLAIDRNLNPRGYAVVRTSQSEDPTPEPVVDRAIDLSIDRNLNPRGYAVARTSQSQDRKEATLTSAPGVTSSERLSREIREQREASRRRGDERFRIRREQTRQASSPRSRNLGSDNARSPSDSQTLFNQLLGTNGRINRAGYIVRAIASSVATGVALVFMDTGSAGALIALVLYIAVLVVAFCSMVRRFHDFNWGGASILLLLIPFVNIVIALMLLFRSGTRGTNNHGHEPVDLAVGF